MWSWWTEVKLQRYWNLVLNCLLKLACAVHVLGGVVNVELVNRSKGRVEVECLGPFSRLLHVLYMYVRGVLLEIYINCILTVVHVHVFFES